MPSFAIIGIVLAGALSVVACAHVLPVMAAISAGESSEAGIFAVAGLLTAFIAGALALATSGMRRTPRVSERLAALVVAWFVAPAFAAIAFVGVDSEMLFTDAYFEAVSAMTTTGATGFGPGGYGIGAPSQTLELWRATLQWIGGFAALLMMMVVLAQLGVGALSLRRAPIPPGNTTGPFGRYWPAMLALGFAYGAVTLAGVVALLVSGQKLVPSLTLAFSAAATGGMLPEHGSAVLETLGAAPAIILAVVMLVCAMSFLRHAGLMRRTPRDYWSDPEVRYVILGALLGGFVLAVIMSIGSLTGFPLLRGVLWMISLMSTSVHAVDEEGFTAIPYMVALGIVFVGGSTMSTAGGLKLMRLALLMKQGAREIARLAHPHGIVHTEFGGRPFTMELMRGVWAMFVLMIVAVLVTASALAAFGLSYEQSLAAAIGAIANAGPVLGFAPDAVGESLGLGAVAVYAAMPAAAKFCVCIAMVAGRVEVLALMAFAGAATVRDS